MLTIEIGARFYKRRTGNKENHRIGCNTYGEDWLPEGEHSAFLLKGELRYMQMPALLSQRVQAGCLWSQANFAFLQDSQAASRNNISYRNGLVWNRLLLQHLWRIPDWELFALEHTEGAESEMYEENADCRPKMGIGELASENTEHSGWGSTERILQSILRTEYCDNKADDVHRCCLINWKKGCSSYFRKLRSWNINMIPFQRQDTYSSVSNQIGIKAQIMVIGHQIAKK